MKIEEFRKDMAAKGCNCAQITFSYFAERQGLDMNKALQIASAFGGGMGKGDVCGAITGAYMALGLAFGNDLEITDRSVLKEKIEKFDEEFAKVTEERNCKDILGVNPHDKKAVEEYKKEHEDFKAICPTLVIKAIEIVEGLMEE